MGQSRDNPRPVLEFISESQDLLGTLGTQILELRQSGSDLERVNTIFRMLRTFQGTALFMGFGRMSELAHKTSDILDGLLKKEFRVSHEVVTLLLRSVDILGRMVGTLGRKQESKTGRLSNKRDFSDKENLDWIDTGLQLLQLEGLLISKSTKKSSRGIFFKRNGGQKRKNAKKKSTTPKRKGKWEITQEIMETFFEEAGEILDGVGPALLELERNPKDEVTLHRLFRLFHTIKGSSEYFGTGEIQETAHGIENILDLMRRKRLPIFPSILNILLQASDVVQELIRRLGDEEDPSGIAKETNELLKFVYMTAGKADPGMEGEPWKQKDSLRSFFSLAENFFIPMREAMGELDRGQKPEKNLGFLKRTSLALKNGVGFINLENVFSRTEAFSGTVDLLIRKGLRKNLLGTLQTDFVELERSFSRIPTGSRQSGDPFPARARPRPTRERNRMTLKGRPKSNK